VRVSLKEAFENEQEDHGTCAHSIRGWARHLAGGSGRRTRNQGWGRQADLGRAWFAGRSSTLEAGLTQAQFAALLGVSKRTLEQWEQGRREPSGAAKTLIRLAELHPKVFREIAA
jgi:DNA-binding XRE family transcriptional regulator